MMHGGPATQTDIKCLANAEYDLTYHGKAAHAALKPEAGAGAAWMPCAWPSTAWNVSGSM